MAVGRDLCIVAVNDAAETFLGRSRTRLAGWPLRQVGPDGPALAALAERALADSASVTAPLLHAGTVQASPWWSGGELVGAVLLAHGPRPVGPAGAPTDLAALAAGLAHEVRNPLAALRGAAELLASDLSAGTGASPEYVSLILREVQRVDALVSRMLDLSRPPSLAKAPVKAAELLHDLAVQARALATARGAAVEVEERYDPAVPPLFADRARLFEALVNLAKNAVEAVPARGGRVVLEAFVDPQLRRRGPDGRVRPLARLVIRDNGPGIGATRDQLFTPFFTTKAGGTGLGLLLARQAAEAHGGMLVLKDLGAAGPGTEAQVLLPLGDLDG